MKNKFKVFLIIFLVISVFLILIFVNKNTDVFFTGDEDFKNDKDVKFMLENGWIKSSIEYYVDGKLDYKLDELAFMYIAFKDDKIEFCNSDEKNSTVCNSYDYKFGDKKLIVYKLDNGDDVIYSYEVIDRELLILTYDSKKFVTKNYYKKGNKG